MRRIQKLISKALSDADHARLQDHSCALLRNHLKTEASAAVVVRLGGVRMLSNAMRRHPTRPTSQAEAMCTLAEIAWACPRPGGAAMVRRGGKGCLDQALAAMDRHPTHAKVQQMACGLFRALSYYADCCASLKSKNVALAVVNSIRRNPRKLNVMMEGR